MEGIRAIRTESGIGCEGGGAIGRALATHPTLTGLTLSSEEGLSLRHL